MTRVTFIRRSSKLSLTHQLPTNYCRKSIGISFLVRENCPNEYHIQLKEDVQPVASHPQKVAHILKGLLTSKLQELIDPGAVAALGLGETNCLDEQFSCCT